jgi:hypothetical protein
MLNSPSRRAFAAALATLAALALLDLAGLALPILRAGQLALFAALFLLVPGWVDPDLPAPLESDPAVPRRPALQLAALVSLVVLLGFLPAFHAWQVLAADRDLAPSAAAFARAPDRYVGTPPPPEPGAVHVYQLDERVIVDFAAHDAPWTLAVRADAGELRPAHRPAEPTRELALRGDNPRRVVLGVLPRGASSLEVSVTAGDPPAPVTDVRLGGALRDPARDLDGDVLRVPLGHLWLPIMLLVQVFLIALPEEYFFRRFLLRALKADREPRLCLPAGLYISRANLISSVLFALAHFVVGFDPARLAVFAPSLLFGWLHERTGSLLAPVLVHAACNLMVLLASTQYLPA